MAQHLHSLFDLEELFLGLREEIAARQKVSDKRLQMSVAQESARNEQRG
jgi:hypothetical protein